MPTTIIRPAVIAYRIRNRFEECECENCGFPLDIGDRAYLAESPAGDAVGCTRECAAAALPTIRPEWVR